MLYRDLLDSPDPHVVLFCPDCGQAFSAHAGDYSFLNPPDDPIVCGHCGSEDIGLAMRTGERFTPIGQTSDAEIVTGVINAVREVLRYQRPTIAQQATAYRAIVALLQKGKKL